MDDWFEVFEKRLTQSLTKKLFKTDKKDTSDKSRNFAIVAKDQGNALPNLRNILREENIKDRRETTRLTPKIFHDLRCRGN